MAKNMERSALGVSVLMIMTGQAAEAAGTVLYQDYSLTAEYLADNPPSFSAADPAPVDKAIIGARSDFSRLLAADLDTAKAFGYGDVQLSARLQAVQPELAAPVADTQAAVVQYPAQEVYPQQVAFIMPEASSQDESLAENAVEHKEESAANITANTARASTTDNTIVENVVAAQPVQNMQALESELETGQLIAGIDTVLESNAYESYAPQSSAGSSRANVRQITGRAANPAANPTTNQTKRQAKVNQVRASQPVRQAVRANVPSTQIAPRPAHTATTDNVSSGAGDVVSNEASTQAAQQVDTAVQTANTAQTASTVQTASRAKTSAEKLAEAAEKAQATSAPVVRSPAAKQHSIALPPSRAQAANAPASSATAGTAQRTAAPAQPKKPAATPSMVLKKPAKATDVLKKQEGDASSEKNLKEVFTASEKRYSLLKQGNWGLNYDARYSYYRDSRIDIATEQNSSRILRFRVEEDAQHTMTNTLGLQYGLRDNVTLSADLPIVAKTDLGKDTQTVGLGDVGLGVRWEPFPLQKGRLPLIVSANVSLPTGDSPYKIDRAKGLSTGKGYYSFGGGVSTRKYVDPVVLFGSASLNYGIAETGLNQSIGSRTLTGIKPNISAGMALGFAYSLNYDVSLTMSYQQAFAVGSEFTSRYRDPKDSKLKEITSKSADQTSATLNMALGVRVSPKTIVNTSVGIGLTEDTPDVSFGVSFPLDFSGFGKKK